MAVLKPSDELASDLMSAVNTRLNAGSGPATVKLYTGTRPDKPNTAPSGGNVLLGTLTCSDPAGSVGSRSLAFGAITQDSSSDATGTASWARFSDSDGNGVIDVDVTTVGGGGFLQMNTTSIVINGPILINSCVISA